MPDDLPQWDVPGWEEYVGALLLFSGGCGALFGGVLMSAVGVGHASVIGAGASAAIVGACLFVRALLTEGEHDS